MSDYKDVFKGIIDADAEIRKEVKLLEFKYLIINELINFRKENKMNQTEFAKLINVKQQAISRFELGEIDPRLSFVSKVLIGMNKEIVIQDIGNQMSDKKSALV